MKHCFVMTLLALSGSLLLAGCGHQAAETPAKETGAKAEAAAPTVQVSPVRLGTIKQILPVTGTLAVLRTQQVTVTPAVAGVLDALPVKLGQPVQRGQIVAHLSTHTLLGQKEQGQATVAQYQVQVQQARANAVQQQAQTQTAIAQAGAAVSGAQATLAGARATLTGNEAALHNAQQSLARVQTLYQEGLVAQKDVESAQLAVQTAAAQVTAQQQAVESQRETVRSQRQALAAAHAARLQNIVKLEDVKVAQQQVKNAQGALATTQGQVALYTLRAPLTGWVTEVGASLGETVDPATKLVSIANLNTLQLQLAVPENSARQVHIGQSVVFRVDSLPGKEFSCTLRSVGTHVDPASNTVEVLAVVSNPRRKLVEGSFLKAQIVIARHPAALLVPKSAVLHSAGGQTTVVTVGADQKSHLQDVKTGLVEDDTVEILSGLKAGERVITTGNYGLPEGTSVTVAGRKATP